MVEIDFDRQVMAALEEARRDERSRVAALSAELEQVKRENRELVTQDDPTFTYAFKLRAEAAETKATRLSERLAEVEKALRIARGYVADDVKRGPTDYDPRVDLNRIDAALATLTKEPVT